MTRTRRHLIFAFAVLAFGLLAVPCFADEPPAEEQLTETVTPGTAGLKIVRDPATGKLRPPTPAEAKAMAKGLDKILSRSTEGLKSVRQPNGTLSLDLKGRFQNASLARRTADGTFATECVTSVDEAEAFLAGESQSRVETAPKEVRDDR